MILLELCPKIPWHKHYNCTLRIPPLLCTHSHMHYFFAEHELREQRQLVEAVRGILTPAVRSALSPEQQAFLDAEASWQPPPPAPGLYLTLWCCCIVR